MGLPGGKESRQHGSVQTTVFGCRTRRRAATTAASAHVWCVRQPRRWQWIRLASAALLCCLRRWRCDGSRLWFALWSSLSSASLRNKLSSTVDWRYDVWRSCNRPRISPRLRLPWGAAAAAAVLWWGVRLVRFTRTSFRLPCTCIWLICWCCTTSFWLSRTCFRLTSCTSVWIAFL